MITTPPFLQHILGQVPWVKLERPGACHKVLQAPQECAASGKGIDRSGKQTNKKKHVLSTKQTSKYINKQTRKDTKTSARTNNSNKWKDTRNVCPQKPFPCVFSIQVHKAALYSRAPPRRKHRSLRENTQVITQSSSSLFAVRYECGSKLHSLRRFQSSLLAQHQGTLLSPPNPNIQPPSVHNALGTCLLKPWCARLRRASAEQSAD